MRCKYATGDCTVDKPISELTTEECFKCILQSLANMNQASVHCTTAKATGYNIALIDRMLRALAYWGEDVGFDVNTYTDDEFDKPEEESDERQYVS